METVGKDSVVDPQTPRAWTLRTRRRRPGDSTTPGPVWEVTRKGRSAENLRKERELLSRTRPRELDTPSAVVSSVLRPERHATINGAIGWVPVSTNLRILALRVIAEAECDLEP